MLDFTPTDYDEILAAVDEREDPQDVLDELGAGLAPATPRQAIANALGLHRHDTYVGVGYCLRTVRGPEYEVEALWPDAETAWEQARGKHPQSDPSLIPRGAPVYWVNGGHGHIALGVGDGLCWTTDFRRAGYVDLAPIAAIAAWCRGRLVGWAEELNGVDVWPDPAEPKPEPVVLDVEARLRVLRMALHVARDRGQLHRAHGIETWIKRLERKETPR